MSGLDAAIRRWCDDQIADARDHLDTAYYYAAGVGQDAGRAVEEIDAALRLLRTARERLVCPISITLED